MNIIKNVDDFVKETPQAKGKSYETWINFMTNKGVIFLGTIPYVVMNGYLFVKDREWAIFFLFVGILWGIYIASSIRKANKKRNKLLKKHEIISATCLSLYDDFNRYEIENKLRSVEYKEPEKLTEKVDKIYTGLRETEKMLSAL
jgi:hypothetical protein